MLRTTVAFVMIIMMSSIRMSSVCDDDNDVVSTELCLIQVSRSVDDHHRWLPLPLTCWWCELIGTVCTTCDSQGWEFNNTRGWANQWIHFFIVMHQTQVRTVSEKLKNFREESQSHSPFLCCIWGLASCYECGCGISFTPMSDNDLNASRGMPHADSVEVLSSCAYLPLLFHDPHTVMFLFTLVLLEIPYGTSGVSPNACGVLSFVITTKSILMLTSKCQSCALLYKSGQ